MTQPAKLRKNQLIYVKNVKYKLQNIAVQGLTSH